MFTEKVSVLRLHHCRKLITGLRCSPQSRPLVLQHQGTPSHDDDHHQGRHEQLRQGLGIKGAQPIVFHHGWPLSSDDWDNQMMPFTSAI